MLKKLLIALLLTGITAAIIPFSASAHDGWHRDWDNGQEREGHRWHARDDDYGWHHHWHSEDYVVQEPVYYYSPQPFYYAPPPPRVVYYQPQPFLNFYFGR